MSFFNRGGEKKTALESATNVFGQNYALYAPTEREAVVSLIAEIYRQTKHPAFGKLAEDMGALAIKLLPLMTSGRALPQLLCAIAKQAPALAHDLSRALGPGVFEAEVAAAAQALR